MRDMINYMIIVHNYLDSHAQVIFHSLNTARWELVCEHLQLQDLLAQLLQVRLLVNFRFGLERLLNVPSTLEESIC
jgi:hypothetical protein